MSSIVTFYLILKPTMFMAIASVWSVKRGYLWHFIIIAIVHVSLSVYEYKHLAFLKSIAFVSSRIIMTMAHTILFQIFFFFQSFLVAVHGSPEPIPRGFILSFLFSFPHDKQWRHILLIFLLSYNFHSLKYRSTYGNLCVTD